MAPLPPLLSFFFGSKSPRSDSAISDLSTSSLELDRRSTDATAASAHIVARDAVFSAVQDGLDKRTEMLVKRVEYNPGGGTVAPDSFNNTGMLALFAILGAAMVIASIWFFFWAKNGGFVFRKGDWEEYKSTVLRRKGPDGKTLSNATKSTKLGGGTIAGSQHYAWQKNYARSVVGRDEKGRKGILGKRGWAGTHSVTYSDDYMTESVATRTVVTDEMTELRSEADHTPDHGHHSRRYRDRDVTAYKKERPARVGGLNRVPDGTSQYDTGTERSELLTDTMTETSEQPIIPKKTDKERERQRERERAERKAREEAKRMERRWKKEAEEAAAALARENERAPLAPPAPAHSPPKKSAAPSAQPSASKQRHRSQSRSASPKKRESRGGTRDFSYQRGPASEVLSTAYTGTSRTASNSYYDEYRPRASENPRYDSDYSPSTAGNRSRTSSPKKKKPATTGGRSGGYRRGGGDSDLE